MPLASALQWVAAQLAAAGGAGLQELLDAVGQRLPARLAAAAGRCVLRRAAAFELVEAPLVAVEFRLTLQPAGAA
jgi:hypothetical protein